MSSRELNIPLQSDYPSASIKFTCILLRSIFIITLPFLIPLSNQLFQSLWYDAMPIFIPPTQTHFCYFAYFQPSDTGWKKYQPSLSRVTLSLVYGGTCVLVEHWTTYFQRITTSVLLFLYVVVWNDFIRKK